MTEQRSFHLGDILTVTTGLLVSPRHMDGIYDILNFMTGDDLFTHQLPRAIGECQPALLAQHPQLRNVQTSVEFDGKEQVDRWLAEQVARFGETMPVGPLDPGDHTRIHPVAELQMRGIPPERIITVEVERP